MNDEQSIYIYTILIKIIKKQLLLNDSKCLRQSQFEK